MSLRYILIVPVWGEQFIERFLRYGLPTQLASGNLPALSAAKCAYHIFTPSADAPRICRAPVFERLRGIMPAFIECIDDVYRGHAYAAMTECHNRGLALGRGQDCVFVFLSPDSLWADGSFGAMHQRITEGKRAILMAGPRVTAEDVLPGMVETDGSIRLNGRDSARLLMRHMHHSARAYLWDKGGNRGAGHYCWAVGDSGLLIRATHLHPVAVRPVEREIRLTTNLDGDFVGRCCPDVSQIHIVTDSDEMCTLEFSEAAYLDGYYSDAPLSAEQHREFLQRNTDAHHRDYLRRPIRIHTGEIGPEWSIAEAESGAVVEVLLRDFKEHHKGETGNARPSAAPVQSSGGMRRLTQAIFQKPVSEACIGPLEPAMMKPDGKHGFVVDLRELGIRATSDADFQGPAATRTVSRLILLESGEPLGPPHQLHDVIRNLGMGRYSHWGDGLHFSTRDNSDPRTNERIYMILLPQTLAGWIRRGWWKVKRRLHSVGARLS